MSGRAMTTLPLSVLLAAAAFGTFALAPSARAQDASTESAAPQSAEAQKIDEYGRIGHCDLTARLDNLAIEVQNNPTAKAFLIGYDPKGEGRDRAGGHLKVARYYLTYVRGIEASRVAVVHGGGWDGKEVKTELWLVPEGAEPPLKPAADNKYTDSEFSGKFDTYVTDALIYREQVEMGYSGDDISRQEFAEKLKQQPGSRGYLVVRAPKGSASGTWRRVGQREVQIIRKDYEIKARRLSSINGGTAAGGYAEVELWILPKSARPPEGAKEESAAELRVAVRLNRLDSHGSTDEDAEAWMLKSIAGALRDNPGAIACLVPREPEVFEYEMDEEAAPSGGESAAQEPPAAEAAGASDGSEDESGAGTEDESEAESVKDVAERWMKVLTTKYGVYPWRVVVLEGKRMPWGMGRLSAWLVPEKARWPDPQAPDEDEIEEANRQRGSVQAETSESLPAPPR